MGEWSNTAYVACDDLDAVARALSTVLAREGIEICPAPAPRVPAQWDPMQYGQAADNDLWAVALVPGAAGWTVLKTAPFELLCERRAGALRSRLSELSRALSARALQLNLYDGTGLVLWEASADGSQAVSGFSTISDDPLEVHGELIPMERVEVGFYLEPAPRELGHPIDADPVATVIRIAAALGGPAGGYWQNDVQVAALIPHRDPGDDAARVLYFRRGEQPVAPPGRLPLQIDLQHWGGAGRMKLRADLSRLDPRGSAEAWLTWTKRKHDDPTPLSWGGASLEAPDPTSGGAFVRAVAAWLEQPVGRGASAGVPVPAHCTVAKRLEPDEGWQSWSLTVKNPAAGGSAGDGRVILRVREDLGAAELADGSDDLVAALRSCLWSGPPRRGEWRGGPALSAEGPVVRELRRLDVEPVPSLRVDWDGASVVGAGWRRGRSGLWRWPSPGPEAPLELAEVEGLVTALRVSPLGGQLAVTAVVPANPDVPGYTASDTAVVSVLDARSGALSWARRGPIQTTRPVWSPEGKLLAIAVPGAEGEARLMALDAADGSPVNLPPLRGMPEWWDEQGLVVRDWSRRPGDGRPGPERVRWTGDGRAEPLGLDGPVTHFSADGRFTLVSDGEVLRVGDAQTGRTTPVELPVELYHSVVEALRLGPPLWLGTRRVVFEASEPLVLDLEQLELAWLMPPSRLQGVRVSRDGTSVLASQAHKRPFWGRVSR